jgi:NAD-dependent SIR2 family protein deacetylase
VDQTSGSADPEPLSHQAADGRFIAYLSEGGGRQTHFECATCLTHYDAADGKTYYTTDGNGKYAVHCPGCVRGEGGPKHPDVVWWGEA